MPTDRTGLRAASPVQVRQRTTPIRTCIGCRCADSWSVLVRVVVAQDEAGYSVVVPDLRHRLPGRGAWLHLDPGCLAQAIRRRAFGRALRVQGSVDVSAVTAYVSCFDRTHEATDRHADPAKIPPEDPSDIRRVRR